MSEGTDFLYPFIEGDERDTEALLRDLAASAEGKGAVSGALQRATLDRDGAVDRRRRRRNGPAVRPRWATLHLRQWRELHRRRVARVVVRPPAVGRRAPARCLADDTAVLTALANDVGFDLVFSRQLIAHSEPGDIALGISTSGNSRNLLVAFDEAARHGLLTIGVAGYDGGEMAASEHVQHCLVVRDGQRASSPGDASRTRVRAVEPGTGADGCGRGSTSEVSGG